MVAWALQIHIASIKNSVAHDVDIGWLPRACDTFEAEWANLLGLTLCCSER